MKNFFKKTLNAEHKGAVAFEYIIILVIMAVAIFFAWGILQDALEDKAEQIANFIGGNGQGEVGNNSYTIPNH